MVASSPLSCLVGSLVSQSYQSNSKPSTATESCTVRPLKLHTVTIATFPVITVFHDFSLHPVSYPLLFRPHCLWPQWLMRLSFGAKIGEYRDWWFVPFTPGSLCPSPKANSQNCTVSLFDGSSWLYMWTDWTGPSVEQTNVPPPPPPDWAPFPQSVQSRSTGMWVRCIGGENVYLIPTNSLRGKALSGVLTASYCLQGDTLHTDAQRMFTSLTLIKKHPWLLCLPQKQR